MIMKKSKGILRSIVVFILLVAAGFLGLEFLGRGSVINVKNASPTLPPRESEAHLPDAFADFGGETPKATIALLISALQNNDLALAARYFSPESRDFELEDLTKLSKLGYLGEMIKYLKSVGEGVKIDDRRHSFTIKDESGEPALEIRLSKNAKNIWKITSL